MANLSAHEVMSKKPITEIIAVDFIAKSASWQQKLGLQFQKLSVIPEKLDKLQHSFNCYYKRQNRGDT